MVDDTSTLDGYKDPLFDPDSEDPAVSSLYDDGEDDGPVLDGPDDWN